MEVNFTILFQIHANVLHHLLIGQVQLVFLARQELTGTLNKMFVPPALLAYTLIQKVKSVLVAHQTQGMTQFQVCV